MSTSHHHIKTLLATVLSMGLLLVIVGTASAHAAHAKVISATPGIGSTIATAPDAVAVQTAENMKPGAQLSNLFVYGPSGELISQGDAKIPLNNPKEMSVPIKATGNGTYIVRWITVSADDGDPDQGAFIFTVKPVAAATPVKTTAPTTSAPPTANSFPVAPVAIASVIALLVGLGAGFGVGRSRAASSTGTAGTQQERDTASTRNP